jgi:hypothetical protein
MSKSVHLNQLDNSPPEELNAHFLIDSSDNFDFTNFETTAAENFSNNNARSNGLAHNNSTLTGVTPTINDRIKPAKKKPSRAANSKTGHDARGGVFNLAYKRTDNSQSDSSCNYLKRQVSQFFI